ncbi:ribonuclease Oy-like [Ptychodera flava]|uniref:ribonuclease Oy-like n=1 Tax=Ptychodera flava TaxID=63121 RepID=UPI00396A5BE5
MAGHVLPVSFSMVIAVICGACITVSLKSESEWDYFVFAQQWPQTLCDSTDWQVPKEHNCSIPKAVTAWTVHGLWPTKSGTEGPNNCNSSWPFNLSEIKDIQPQMEVYWPNLFTDSKLESFWEHEWDKHGTCGTDLEAIDTEYKFFSAGLKLYHKLDFLKALSSNGIAPSLTKSYSYNDVMKAFTNTFGSPAELTCYYNHTTQTSYLQQVSLCITKEFEVFDCKMANHSFYIPRYGNEERCWLNESVVIPPIVHSG